MQGYKESRSPFPSEWEVWKRFFQGVVNFSCVKNSLFKFFKVSNFKVKVFGRKFFELLKILTLKFEKVCAREFFDSLKV